MNITCFYITPKKKQYKKIYKRAVNLAELSTIGTALYATDSGLVLTGMALLLMCSVVELMKLE